MSMHDFMVALAFVAMMMTPCLVALGTSLDEDAGRKSGSVPPR